MTPDQLSAAWRAGGDADPDGEPPPPSPDPQLEDRLRRALADLDNLRKRYDRELTLERTRERARVTAEWLPVVANLERALQHAGAEERAVLEGVRAVYEQAVAVLARLGFPRFDDVGEPFDANRHEAVT